MRTDVSKYAVLRAALYLVYMTLMNHVQRVFRAALSFLLLLVLLLSFDPLTLRPRLQQQQWRRIL